MTWAIRPWLTDHVLASPNARSSHSSPTPQGAGIAVVLATLIVATAIMVGFGNMDTKLTFTVFAAALFLAVVGFAADVKSIPIVPRLILQAICVGAVLFATPGDLRIIPSCPLLLERGLLLFVGLWFVNLVNFMDGLDWMTVAEVIPVTGALVLLGYLGALSPSATIVAAALGGAMVGFSPFNRPVAKIFLGDVGSLPVGLLLGWCLMELMHHQHLTAAILLPLYYLSDATITLSRRLTNREQVWRAHRSHFYQRAIDNGFTVLRVVSELFVLNVGLAMLAIVSALTESPAINVVVLIIGISAVVWLMYRFSRQRQVAPRLP